MKEENAKAETIIVLTKTGYYRKYSDWRDAAKDLITIETGKSKEIDEVLDRFRVMINSDTWRYAVGIENMVTFTGCLLGWEVSKDLVYHSKYTFEN